MSTDSDLKPLLFVGSSTRGIEAARAVQYQLSDVAEVHVWNEGAFGLNEGTLESLVLALDKFHFAVLVVTPDDLVIRDGEKRNSPRDNVLFEVGLFMGHLGRERTFIVCRRDPQLWLPSDLAGVTLALFDEPTHPDHLEAALGPACYRVRNALRKAGRLGSGRLGARSELARQMGKKTANFLAEDFAESREKTQDGWDTGFNQLLQKPEFGEIRDRFSDKHAKRFLTLILRSPKPEADRYLRGWGLSDLKSEQLSQATLLAVEYLRRNADPEVGMLDQMIARGEPTRDGTAPPGTQAAVLADAPINSLSLVSFQATPHEIQRGEPSVLSWVVRGATEVVISQGVGRVQSPGSRTVFPGTTVQYILTAVTAEGIFEARVDVIVRTQS
jgi:hypothetical protein